MTRRLIVMRHAKAEQVAASDHERVLAGRGLRDAAEAGRWAAEVGYLPDHVVVSSAARTRGTWVRFALGAGLALEPDVDRALYSAGTDGALEIARFAPAAARTAMLVGHNPTMESLVHLLDDGGADVEVFDRLAAGFPTSAIGVLEISGDWSDLEIGSARLTDFHVPRG
ncbi:MAG: Phosphoglycerate mutase [Marmoricola sp.]|nr:Phosphoglycerate mutase [Marmoricola sp.]